MASEVALRASERIIDAVADKVAWKGGPHLGIAELIDAELRAEREASEKMAEIVRDDKCRCDPTLKYHCIRCRALAAYEKAKGGA